MRRANLFFFNTYGRLSSSATTIPVLTLPQKDGVYLTQLPLPEPWLLTPTTFHIAQILDNDYQSREAYKSLVRMEILSREGEISTAPVERPNFGKDIMSKLAFIPQIKIKMVVDFLFWWNEEAQRLKNLATEKTELTQMVREGHDPELQRLLRRVQRRIDAVPSQRDEADELGLEAPAAPVVADNPFDLPPVYTK